MGNDMPISNLYMQKKTKTSVTESGIDIERGGGGARERESDRSA
jgi:hypothetical protein